MANPWNPRLNPSFCPICGTDFQVHQSVRPHLVGVHRLEGRPLRQVLNVAWREVTVASLELTPSWDD